MLWKLQRSTSSGILLIARGASDKASAFFRLKIGIYRELRNSQKAQNLSQIDSAYQELAVSFEVLKRNAFIQNSFFSGLVWPTVTSRRLQIERGDRKLRSQKACLFSISRKQIFSKILSQILLFKLLYFTFGREILGENPLKRQSENCEVHRRELAAK